MGKRAAIFLLVVLSFATVAGAQQTPTPIQFPSTQDTAVTDCSTPTTLTLAAGQTVTLTGGQFIRYTDGNFDGVMYATASTAGGCSNDLNVYFSPPVSSMAAVLYNFGGPDSFYGFVPFRNDRTDPMFGETGFLAHADFTASYGLAAPRPNVGKQGSVSSFELNTTLPAVEVSPGRWVIPPGPTTYGWGITELRIPQGAPDFVRFDYPESMSGSDDGRILVSTAVWDATRPSRYQVFPANGIEVKVSGTLIDGTTKQPKSGAVYLRLDDPPDTAGYRAGDSRSGDNDGPPATLSGAGGNGIAVVQTDAQGKFEATLSVTSHVAGDNYQITGSPNDKFNCATGPCPRSGTFTLWKRVYAEEEHMFRQGAFIADVTSAGATQVPVDDPAPFRNLASGALLELVHAESGRGEGFYSEMVAFRGLTQQPGGQWMVEIDPSSPLVHAYGASPTNSSIDLIRRDGMGIANAGTYQPNGAYVSSLFASMFVDVMAARQTISEVPYVREIDNVQRIYYSSRWLQAGAFVNSYSRHADANVHHRIGATQSPLVTVPGGTGAELGVTGVAGGSNNSFIFVQRIEDVAAARLGPIGAEYNGLDPIVINGETTAHEMVHFWVHDAGADGNGHCVQVAYGTGLNCLLHMPYAGPGLADGIVQLHYVQHGTDSEYMTVRRAADPVPQQ